jgi:hypothetical protein
MVTKGYRKGVYERVTKGTGGAYLTGAVPTASFGRKEVSMKKLWAASGFLCIFPQFVGSSWVGAKKII